LNANPESQWQIINRNISQNFSLSVIFLDVKFCKNLGFVNEAPALFFWMNVKTDLLVGVLQFFLHKTRFLQPKDYVVSQCLFLRYIRQAN
jgi:hypothetical protein